MGYFRCCIICKSYGLRGDNMIYQNKKTGFVFESDSVCNGEDWTEVQSSPIKEEATEIEEKPKKKRTKKS